MRSIYPKLDSKLNGIHALKKYMDRYKGLEIEFLEVNPKTGQFEFENEIRTIYELFPNIKEIIITPPKEFNRLEWFLCKDKKLLLKQAEIAMKLSEELGIQVNLLYSLGLTYSQSKIVLVPFLQELLNQIKGYDVFILLEDDLNLNEEFLSSVDLCKFLGEKQLKVCLNVSTLKKKAVLAKVDLKTYMKKNLDSKTLKKHIYEVHFGSIPKNEVISKVESIRHKTRKELLEDLELLYEYGMFKSIFVPLIFEKDENMKEEQKKEIDTMEDIYKVMNEMIKNN